MFGKKIKRGSLWQNTTDRLVYQVVGFVGGDVQAWSLVDEHASSGAAWNSDFQTFFKCFRRVEESEQAA